MGRLKGIPGVFSQGETLQELEDNIREVYQLMMEDEPVLDRPDLRKRLDSTCPFPPRGPATEFLASKSGTVSVVPGSFFCITI